MPSWISKDVPIFVIGVVSHDDEGRHIDRKSRCAGGIEVPHCRTVGKTDPKSAILRRLLQTPGSDEFASFLPFFHFLYIITSINFNFQKCDFGFVFAHCAPSA